jgi:hypothetical protein
MELPIIATNWSGNTEFMTNENSFLLPIEGLVPIKTGSFKDSGMKVCLKIKLVGSTINE